jgi:hypothetical protein
MICESSHLRYYVVHVHESLRIMVTAIVEPEDDGLVYRSRLVRDNGAIGAGPYLVFTGCLGGYSTTNWAG